MLNWIKAEPVRFAMLFLSFVAAVIGVLRVFGVALTDTQVDAITELWRVGIEIVVFVVAGETLRGKVSPTAMLALLSTGLALSVTGCSKQQVAQFANAVGANAAQLLCAEYRSQERNITVEQALETACATEDLWAPWKSAADEARALGASRAASRGE